MAAEPSPRARDARWIGPLGWGLIAVIVAAFLIAWLGGRLLIDRLTVHNRTTTPISFTDDEYGFYSNDVGACTSREFEWRKGNGWREGWRPDGAAEHHGNAIEIELPVERWFEAGLADHFFVLVTSEGVTEVDADDPVPDCEGEPPE